MDRRELLDQLGLAGLVGLAAVGGALEAAADHREAPADAGAGPLAQPFAHFCGIHVAKKDSRLQWITQHYCVAHNKEKGHDDEGLFQCLLFDSTEKDAKLV